MHFSEAEIQAYLWANRERFADLLVIEGELDEIQFKDDLSDLTAQALIHNRTIRRLKAAYEKLYGIKLIGNEVPLEQQSNSTIRTDFLATFPGDTGIGIIELKKSCQTERQAFTELLAYSNHLTTQFPGMSRDDAVYVLISPMTTRICRDALIQSFVFDNRIVVGLMPVFEDPLSLDSLRLKLWIPQEKELAEFSSVAFREENFSVCKIVWEYSEGWWDAVKGGDLSSSLMEQLNNVSSLAAQFMEESGIHGFTYTSQVWSELSPVLPFTNALVLVGLNPYAVGGAQFLAKSLPLEELPSPQVYLPNLAEVIPGLNNHAKSLHEDDHHLLDLHQVWDSQLFRIGKQVVKAATQTTNGKSLQTDQGFFDWKTYQIQFLEDVTCHNLDVRPTGLIRHLYMSVTRLDYEICGKVGVEKHPIHGDIPHNAIEALTSQFYFRRFILRMLGETYGIRLD